MQRASQRADALVPGIDTHENEELAAAEAAEAVRGSELCLMAVDKKYPVLPCIRSLLPDDEALLTRVLSNQGAAKAIMLLSDAEYSTCQMEKQGWTEDEYITIMLDGEELQLHDTTAIDLAMWLDMRDIPTTNLGVAALKGAVIKRINLTTYHELDNAKARLGNIIKEFQRV